MSGKILEFEFFRVTFERFKLFILPTKCKIDETNMKYLFSIVLLFFIAKHSLGYQNLDSLNTQLELATGTDKVDVLNNLFIYYSQLNPTKALEYSMQALQLAKESEYERGRAAALNNIGVIYKNQGVYDVALDYYIKSLRISNEIDDKKGSASSMNNIGTVYSLKGVYDKALIYFKESHDILKSFNDRERLIGSLNNIGNAYSDKGDKDEALVYFTNALEMSNDLQTSYRSSEPLNNIGNIHFFREEYDEALDYYQRSLEICIENDNLLGKAQAISNLGSVYQRLGDFQKAKALQTEALTIAKDIEANPLLVMIYEGLSGTYYGLKEYKEAYDARILYDRTKENVNNEESSRKLARLEVGFEIQQKEKELEMLRQDQKIKTLQVKNSNIVILLGLMGTMLLIAAGFVVYSLKKAKKQQAKSTV